MKDSLYVDDIVLSTNNLESASNMYEKTRSRKSSGCSRPRNWLNNSFKLRQRSLFMTGLGTEDKMAG